MVQSSTRNPCRAIGGLEFERLFDDEDLSYCLQCQICSSVMVSIYQATECINVHLSGLLMALCSSSSFQKKQENAWLLCSHQVYANFQAFSFGLDGFGGSFLCLNNIGRLLFAVTLSHFIRGQNTSQFVSENCIPLLHILFWKSYILLQMKTLEITTM